MTKRILYFILFLYITSVSAQKNFQLEGYLAFDNRINDIWAYEDGLGNEYALIGSEFSLYIVNVTIPDQASLLFEISGPKSQWRDVKVYNDFAYVVNEEKDGLLIVDLSQLPTAAPAQLVTTLDTFNFQTAHNIFIDENGIAYLLGSNISNGGAFIIDLNTTNRYQPEYIGMYDDQYVHDAYVRGDTLYTSEINNGTFSVIDISDKANPLILARQTTSRAYTHNCWLSDDGDYLITTDEKPGGFVDIYDISNLNNIKRIDLYQSSPTDSVIPHNTFFKGDYIFTSYYRNGLTLVDATIKDNLVEVGFYDTSPFSAANGFEGNWGVYPYLNSGNILVSDREEGLFIVKPSYTRAAYLRGNVMDTLNNIPIGNAQIEVMGTNYLKNSQFNGSYSIGVADSAFYDIRLSHPNCQTVIKTNVLIETGIEKVLNFETNCDFFTAIKDENKSNEIDCTIQSNGDFLTISIQGPELLETVQLVDLQGKIHARTPVNAQSSTIEYAQNLTSGMYFIQMSFETFKHTQKFIIP